MAIVNINPIYTIKKIKKKQLNIKSFIIDNENINYLIRNIINYSKFVNDAIRFYIMLINNPKKIMIELKKRNPEVWKYVNRKKF